MPNKELFFTENLGEAVRFAIAESLGHGTDHYVVNIDMGYGERLLVCDAYELCEVEAHHRCKTLYRFESPDKDISDISQPLYKTLPCLGDSHYGSLVREAITEAHQDQGKRHIVILTSITAPTEGCSKLLCLSDLEYQDMLQYAPLRPLLTADPAPPPDYIVDPYGSLAYTFSADEENTPDEYDPEAMVCFDFEVVGREVEFAIVVDNSTYIDTIYKETVNADDRAITGAAGVVNLALECAADIILASPEMWEEWMATATRFVRDVAAGIGHDIPAEWTYGAPID